MDKQLAIKRIKDRAAIFADSFLDDVLADLQTETNPKLRTLSRNSLMAGWMKGYAEAMTDAVAMQEIAGAVKH